MKKFYFLFLLTFSLFSSLHAQNKDGRLVLYARATGANEVPVVNTRAKALVTFTIEQDYETVTVNGVADSLSGAIANIHIHQAAAGVNGGVIVNLISMVKGNRIYGTFKATKAQIAAMMTRNTYLNIHTAANPGGEIRGQIILESDFSFVGVLSGANEVPAVNNPTGFGVASVTLSNTFQALDYKIAVTGLTGAITAAHFHYGAAGRNGGVVHTLTVQGKYLVGSIVAPTLTNQFLDSLLAGRVYVNVHTAANSGGEIRGNLSLVSFAAADAVAIGANEIPAVTSPARGVMFSYPNFTLDTINYVAVYDSLTPTAAHVHTGARGVSGGVISGNLTPIPNIRGYLGAFAAKPDTMSKYFKGELYWNVHTTANTAGEIRDQLSTTVRNTFVSNLCAAQEVPVVTNAWNASGAGMVSIDRNRTNAHLEIVTNRLSANATAGHIHRGEKGVNGGVVLNFSGTLIASGNSVSGFAPLATFSPAFIDSVLNGQTYLNIHTALNSGGEIRGQIGRTVEQVCIPTGTYELNGQNLSVKVFPNPFDAAVNVDFESNEDFSAQIVISDMIGRSIVQKNQNILRGANALQINTANFSNGVYFIQLKKEGRLLFSEKVVKQ
jgi:Cu/Zn superoxide dismutase